MSLEPKKQIEVLSRGAAELISPTELEQKLKKGKPLKVKLGFDPTVADLHLGHTVVMQKLKQFQELGHQVIFLIGDFTARIGDPSGQTKTRPVLTEKEVRKNAKTYLAQAFKILDKKKTKVHRNSKWFTTAKMIDMIDLAGQYNVARMMEREDFRKRFKEGGQITIREFLYPLLQGYDSVRLGADVELGGNDQKFNLVVARDIQRAFGGEPEVILTMPLLVGTDGVQKMSKSYGNTIGITEPPKEIFGKIMSLSDELMIHYYELLTEENLEAVKAKHPKEAKVELAKKIVARFYSEKAADQTAQEFEQIFVKREKPCEINELDLKAPEGELSLVEVLATSKLASSKTEARRLIEQNAVRVDDERIADLEKQLTSGRTYLLQVGKRRFLKVRVE